jgi:hypothetical protein
MSEAKTDARAHSSWITDTICRCSCNPGCGCDCHKAQAEEIARLTRLVSVLQEGKDTWRRAATADYAKLVEVEAELEKARIFWRRRRR